MFVRRFLRPILGGLALVAVGATAAPPHGTPDACGLFTVGELSGLVGKAIVGGNKSTSGTGGGQCTYGYGMTQFWLELNEYSSPAQARQKWADEMKKYQTDPAFGPHTTAVESGVGDAAFSSKGTFAGSKMILWSTVRGTRVLHVVNFGPELVSSDRVRAVALKGITR